MVPDFVVKAHPITPPMVLPERMEGEEGMERERKFLVPMLSLGYDNIATT